MNLAEGAFLFLAAVLGGALNSVVGGGSFVAFPALLLAGVPAVSANATTTLALWPASIASTIAYRDDLRRIARPQLLWFSVASVVGGAVGAFLLLHTSNTTFVRLVPWLLLFATLLFTLGGPLTARLRAHPANVAKSDVGKLVVGTLVQLLISAYGGFFGGGMGIMMLATWSVLGMTDIHAMNGLRTLLGTILNGVALAAFLLAGAIAWRQGLLMMAGATVAGYLGAAAARRIDPRWVKRFVMGVAWAMTGYFFARAYHLL